MRGKENEIEDEVVRWREGGGKSQRERRGEEGQRRGEKVWDKERYQVNTEIIIMMDDTERKNEIKWMIKRGTEEEKEKRKRMIISREGYKIISECTQRKKIKGKRLSGEDK